MMRTQSFSDEAVPCLDPMLAVRTVGAWSKDRGTLETSASLCRCPSQKVEAKEGRRGEDSGASADAFVVVMPYIPLAFLFNVELIDSSRLSSTAVATLVCASARGDGRSPYATIPKAWRRAWA